MEQTAPPITPQGKTRVLKQEGKAVLALSLRRPGFPDRGRTKRVERYFAHLAQMWEARWETVLFPRACQARAAAREMGAAFAPWEARLDYVVTLWAPPLISLRLNAVEDTGGGRPFRFRMGETWDCAGGYPRPLRAFLPKNRRWRKALLAQLGAQAEGRLAAGEALFYPDCAQRLAQAFDPERFYLTQEGLAVFYPLYALGPYGEGIPVFSVPLT